MTLTNKKFIISVAILLVLLGICMYGYKILYNLTITYTEHVDKTPHFADNYEYFYTVGDKEVAANRSSYNNIFYMVDKGTNVVYICYKNEKVMTMTPRLHPDGTPYLKDEMPELKYEEEH